MTSKKTQNLEINIAGVALQNPLIAASGTFGYGTEYETIIEVNSLGGICSKGLTLEKKTGNEGIRLVETPSGLINSIGLENPGIPHFIEHELETMLQFDAKTIVNLSGSTIESYIEGAKLLDNAITKNNKKIELIELNISCPNVKAGGMAFGLDPKAASEVTKAVRDATSIPLIVKLSPNASDIVAIANAVRESGANAISLVNTFQAIAIDINTGKPIFNNIKAGLSGPAIKPLALRMVWDVCSAMNKLPKDQQIPVIGLGGISTWQDAIEFIMAGATALQVGTATFSNPNCMHNIINGLGQYMAYKGYKTIEDFRGIALT